MPRYFEPGRPIAVRNWRRPGPPKAIPGRQRARFGAPRRGQTYPVFFSFSSLGMTWTFKESSLYSPEMGKRSSRKMNQEKMTKDECRMTKECQSPNDNQHLVRDSS